jgi:hypothetical protein
MLHGLLTVAIFYLFLRFLIKTRHWTIGKMCPTVSSLFWRNRSIHRNIWHLLCCKAVFTLQWFFARTWAGPHVTKMWTVYIHYMFTGLALLKSVRIWISLQFSFFYWSDQLFVGSHYHSNNACLGRVNGKTCSQQENLGLKQVHPGQGHPFWLVYNLWSWPAPSSNYREQDIILSFIRQAIHGKKNESVLRVVVFTSQNTYVTEHVNVIILESLFWNSVPENIRSLQSFAQFRKAVDKYYNELPQGRCKGED